MCNTAWCFELRWQFSNGEVGSASQVVSARDRQWLTKSMASSKGAKAYRWMFARSIKEVKKQEQVDLGDVKGAAADSVRDAEIHDVQADVAVLQDREQTNSAKLVRWQPLHTPACNSPQFT